MAGSASGQLAIGPFVYVRFHGTQKYSGSYSDGALDEWADWLAERHRDGRPVYVYFNNDTGGHAPRDAVRLRDRIAALCRVPNASRDGCGVSSPTQARAASSSA